MEGLMCSSAHVLVRAHSTKVSTNLPAASENDVCREKPAVCCGLSALMQTDECRLCACGQKARVTSMCVPWLPVGECTLVCEQHRGTLCEWVHRLVILPLSCWRKRSEGIGCRNSCASRGKHIGQLRHRLCTELHCVGLIESGRHPLTALCFRTLLVITHKSLFPCIGSSVQLRPHKLSTSASFINSVCLLTFTDTVHQVPQLYNTEEKMLHLELWRHSKLQSLQFTMMWRKQKSGRLNENYQFISCH